MIAPFWTHLDKNDQPCGILVSRGWIPFDLKDQDLDKNIRDSTRVKGILYRGDAKTKYQFAHYPARNQLRYVDPKELAVLA